MRWTRRRPRPTRPRRRGLTARASAVVVVSDAGHGSPEKAAPIKRSREVKAERGVLLSMFASLTDTRPQLQRCSRADLELIFTNHLERPTKGGAGFGPAI